MLAPLLVSAYPSNPPLGLTGAPGEGTCGGCHSPVTSGSSLVSATLAGGLTYTPGGGAVTLTVTLGGSGGYELSSRVLNDNSQAGSIAAADANSGVGASGTIQYAYQTNQAATWALSWTPPATNVGNVVLYVASVQGNVTYTNSFTVTPASAPPPDTLSVDHSSLTFNYSGTAPPAQTVQVTSSGASLAFTTAVGTTSGGNWLSATPSGGNTPMGVSVSASATGLSTGTYTGTVTISATGASNSPQTVNVTFNVTNPPPLPTPTISSMPSSLTFTVSAPGGTASPQNITVSASDNSALTLGAAASTTSGGNWLSVTPSSGSTPATFSIGVTTTGLTNGTYMGSISITTSGASNSPLSVPVTLTIGSTPPKTAAIQFSFHVIDKQTGASNDMLLVGTGMIDNAGDLIGRGTFNEYKVNTGGGDATHATISTGTWTALSVVSYTPGTGSTNSGGVLILKVKLNPAGGSSMMGTMRIADTGSDKGVTLTITGGPVFAPTGTGTVVIAPLTSGCPGGGGGGGEKSSEDIRPSISPMTPAAIRRGDSISL